MKMKLILKWGATLGAVVALSAIGFAQNPGRNAFLQVSARTTDQLVAQVKANRNIRDSYLRHFAMDEKELYAYLRTLRPVRLEEEGVFTVYSVPPSGELIAHTQRLKKGELVFVDRAGRPILRARCGNPMGTPDMPDAIPATALGIPPSEMRHFESPMPEEIPVALFSMQPAAPVVPEMIVETPPAPQPIVEPERSQALSWLPLLAVPLVWEDKGSDNPVPEPLTMLGLAAGAGALMMRKRRSK